MVMAAITTSTMPASSAGPTAITVRVLTEAPSSSTAISRSALALKLIPGSHRVRGVHAVRMAVPSRMARTSASSHARPKRCSSATCIAMAASVTTPQRSSPGKIRQDPVKKPEADGDSCHDAICFSPEVGVTRPLIELDQLNALVPLICFRHDVSTARPLPTAVGARLLNYPTELSAEL